MYPTGALDVNGILRLMGTNILGLNTNGAIGYNPNGPSINSVTGDVVFAGGSYENIVFETPTTGPGRSGGALAFVAGSTPAFTALPSGQFGIDTTTPQYTLAVNGTIGAKGVIVTSAGWSDYVFKPDYRLMGLKELDVYVKENHHLPGIPSETEVRDRGMAWERCR